MSRGDTLADALASGRGNERPFRCHVHEDSNASASVNVQLGVWICYACGARGKVDGVDLVPDVDRLFELLAGERQPRTYPESWLDIFDADESSSYWSKRYGHETASAFRCGTDPVTGRPTYPLREFTTGNVWGVVARDEDGQPKYKYPYGVPTSHTFFGELVYGAVVILVEGAADVMALHAAGLHSDNDITTLGCYGAGLHKPQADHLSYMDAELVILAFDDDDAGRAAMARSDSLIDPVIPRVSYLWGSIGGKDPGEVSPTQAAQAMHHLIDQTIGRNAA